MEYADYYTLLGIKKIATQNKIKRDYKILARKHHPNLNNDEVTEVKIKEIGETNEVQNDLQKRVAYDQLGKAYRPRQDFRPPLDLDTGSSFPVSRRAWARATLSVPYAAQAIHWIRGLAS